MKAVVRAVVLAVLVVLLPADPAFSEVQKPIRDPGACVECNRNNEGVITCGFATEWGEPGWSMCIGGCSWQCIPGGGACECIPRCGNRCYSI